MQDFQELKPSEMLFAYTDGNIQSTKKITDDHTWLEYLREFIHFLEGCGYKGVTQRVAIDPGIYTADEIDWSGPTFDSKANEDKVKAVSADDDDSLEFTEDGQWVINNGKEPKHLNNFQIEIVLRDGTVNYGRVSYFHWDIDNSPVDIIKYRLA